MGVSAGTQQNQIVIPAPLRRKLDIEPGTNILVSEAEAGVRRFQPLIRAHVERRESWFRVNRTPQGRYSTNEKRIGEGKSTTLQGRNRDISGTRAVEL